MSSTSKQQDPETTPSTSSSTSRPAPSARLRKGARRPSPKARDEAFARIHAQVARRRDADAKARRERETLERLVAESVSAEPLSVTWYDHPGVLSREEVLAFGSPRNAVGLHALMERHRKRSARA